MKQERKNTPSISATELMFHFSPELCFSLTSSILVHVLKKKGKKEKSILGQNKKKNM